MSTIAQIFESGEQKSLKGHFRNLVLLARADGEVADAETILLARMARRLSLTDDQVKEICDNVDDYPVIPPVGKEERLERFVRLVQMVLVDGEISDREKALVLNLGVALGIDENAVEPMFNKVVSMWLNGMDTYEIIDNI